MHAKLLKRVLMVACSLYLVQGFRLNEAIERLFMNYDKARMYSQRSPSKAFTVIKRTGNTWYIFNPINKIGENSKFFTHSMIFLDALTFPEIMNNLRSPLDLNSLEINNHSPTWLSPVESTRYDFFWIPIKLFEFNNFCCLWVFHFQTRWK